jgi:uncharacterized protein
VIKFSTVNIDREGIDIAGTEPGGLLGLEADCQAVDSGELSYDLHASMVNNGILLNGSVKIELRARCGRCLKEFPYELVNDSICHFYEGPGGAELDITDDIREDALILLPQNFTCSEDCRGLCPNCGRDLNEETCACSRVKAGADVWSELDNLNIEK